MTNNKNDYIHFYSNHNDKTKSSILIGFFLRALRICSTHYLNEEIKHIKNSFSKLQYPDKSKAINIHKHTSQYKKNNNINNKANFNINLINRHVILSQNPTTTYIEKNLNSLGINTTNLTTKTTNLTTKTIKQILMNHLKNLIYNEIHCHECKKFYIGETSRNLNVRIYKHKNDFKNGNTTNFLVSHYISPNHTFDFKNSTILSFIHDKNKVRILEACSIIHFDTIPQR